jgi:hypothetical protein
MIALSLTRDCKRARPKVLPDQAVPLWQAAQAQAAVF